MNPSHKTRFLQTLAQVRHFSGLPIGVQDALAQAAALRRFPTGHIIYLEGEPAETIFILESGWVKSTRLSSEGREQAMLFLRTGEVFGDVATLTGTPYPCTVSALEPVEAWAIDQADLLDLIARCPELALAIIRRLGERVIHYVGLVEDLTLRSVEARLAHTLIKHAQHDGDRMVVPRRTWTTFDEMAVRLGTVRDVLARALHTLEQEGLLRVEKQFIIILDIQGLTSRGNS